jgi:hypothetical protein
MKKAIKILLKTPFDTVGNIVSISEFREKYGHVCTKNTTDEELFSYLEREFLLAQKTPELNVIGHWFQVIEIKPKEPPLFFIYNDLYYSKEMDGLYHVFQSPTHYKDGQRLYRISISEALELIHKAKYMRNVLYCTDDVNKKF